MPDFVPAFEVENVPLDGVHGIAVRGEVDIDTAPRLAAALDAAIRDSSGPFVIDLGDVEFLDSSGVNVLLRARALLGRGDRALAVICPAGAARRVFEVAGIADLFTFHASREQAGTALRSSSGRAS